jgi:magnesium-transporting ATPase (P-type)
MFEIAEENVQEKEAMLQEIYESVESDLTLLGASAVEDRLQDDVLETI